MSADVTPRPRLRDRLQWPSAVVLIDTAVLLVLAVLALLGLATAFSNTGYLVAGVGGLFVGALAALVAATLRFGPLLAALTAVVAYFLFGTAIALPSLGLFVVIPSLSSLSGLAFGAVFGWADLLTLVTPVEAPDHIAVLPYIAGMLVGLAATTVAARWFPVKGRTALGSLAALAAPAALFVAALLLGTEEAYLSAVRGIAFALIALVWIGLRPSTATSAASGSSALRRRRLVGVGIVTAGALVLGGVGAFAAVPAQSERFVLRDEIQPPFDPLAYPSPLSGFRKYTKDLTETVLMTATGLEPGDRIRLATMDAYNGQLWSVADASTSMGGSGAFRLVGRDLPAPDLVTEAGERAVQITIADYRGVWLPAVGYPTRVEFAGAETPDSSALRQNGSTGIVAVASGVTTGFDYTLDAVVQEQLTDAELGDVGVAEVSLPPISNVPDIVTAKAIELAGDAAAPIDRLRSIETALHSLGFLSHGTASDQVASSAGHGADRLKALFERPQWVGDQEQFASAFALMARSLGYPARVVMGFDPEVTTAGQTVEITGDDVTAWVEVAFDDVGWIMFDPTPDESEVPQDQAPLPKSEPQPQVRQPPSSDAQLEDLVSAVEVDDSDDEKKESFEIPAWVWTLAASVLIPLAIILVPLLIVAAIKASRRRRRRRAATEHERASGAFDEVVDAYAELGYRVPRRRTRVELADDVADGVTDEASLRGEDAQAAAEQIRADLQGLAIDADRAVFAGADVPAGVADDLWVRSAESVAAGRGSVSPMRRFLSRYRIRSERDLVGSLTDRLPAGARTGGARSTPRRSTTAASTTAASTTAASPTERTAAT